MRGTRILAETIVAELAIGTTWETLKQMYPSIPTPDTGAAQGGWSDAGRVCAFDGCGEDCPDPSATTDAPAESSPEPLAGGTTAPTWRHVLLAAYYAGLGLNLDEDVPQTDGVEDNWRHREWSITNAHQREAGRLVIDTGDGWMVVKLIDRRGRFDSISLTDPAPRDVLAAARTVGLLPAEPEPLSDAEVEKLGRNILLRGFDMGHKGVLRLYATIARDRADLDRLRAEVGTGAAKLHAVNAVLDAHTEGRDPMRLCLELGSPAMRAADLLASVRAENTAMAAKINALLEPHALVQRNLAWLGEKGELHVTGFTVCDRCVPEHAYFSRREDVPEGPCELRAALGETGGTDA
jgi:hypothetical protein